MFYGLHLGWLPPLKPTLQSPDSPLGPEVPPLTDEEITWVVLFFGVSFTLAAPFFGYTLDKYGRKISALLSVAPNIISYLFLIFARNIYMIYIAQCIRGFCACGAFVVTPIYVNETCEPHLRGFLGGSSGSFIKLGTVLAFALGGYASYLSVNLASMCLIFFFVAFYFWLPESPVYLINKGQKEEAKLVLKKIRGPDQDFIENEFNRIQNMDHESEKSLKRFTLARFFTTRRTLTGTVIICGVIAVQNLSGYPAIVRYTVDIFDNSEASVSPYLAAIFLNVAQLLSALIGATILDKVGRKWLLMICTGIMAVSLIILSTYLYLKAVDELATYVQVLKLLPTIGLLFFIMSYSAGFGSVPFVLSPELFGPKWRGTAAAVVGLWTGANDLIVTQTFPIITSWIGLTGSLSICSTNCCVGILFLYFIVFETKGLEFKAIYKQLNGGRDFSKDSKDFATEMGPFVRRRSSARAFATGN